MVRTYNFKELEAKQLKFWEDNKVLESLREKNQDKKKFYFLQGPPFTTGKIHIGHTWNHALKDVVVRLKRMQGFNVWDRGGYDMHGLPTELKVMDKFGLKYKEEIEEKLGLDKFNDECLKYSIEMMEQMNKDLKKCAISLDFENSYKPVDSYYIEGIWNMIAKAYKNERVYKGKRTLSWCSECGSPLAKHELEYETLDDQSIFVAMQNKENDNEFFVIWTTTPWTVPFNLGIMVNPDVTYVKCKVTSEGDNQGKVFILAEDLCADVMNNKLKADFEIVEKLQGKELEGLSYIHPFSDVFDYSTVTDSNNLHTVLLSKEFVDTTAGTGLVHCAPGCGPQDYEVGHKYGLPAYNSVLPDGSFPEEWEAFKGKLAKTDDKFFIKELENRNSLIAKQTIRHEYAHCWRHKKPIIFRTTEQWFLKVEDIKEKIIEKQKDTTWVPKISRDQFEAWISNLRDNSITKQRYWGVPAPIWINVEDESDVIVVKDGEELKALGCEVPENLHRPYIDNVVIKKDGKEYKRIPDVLDVWIDSGCASWNCLYNQPENIKEWFPADFILEAKEQIRLWFYILAVCGELNEMPEFPFKHAYTTGLLMGPDGKKMSKSIGNVITPDMMIEPYGVDTMRTYLTSLTAGVDINYNDEEVRQKYRNLNVLWNLYQFVLDVFRISGLSIEEVLTGDHDFSILDRYMLSRLNLDKKKINEHLESYELDKAQNIIEQLYLDFSRDYIKRARDNAQSEDKAVKAAALFVMYETLVDIIKMFNLFAPFICEEIYQEVKTNIGGLEEVSVSHEKWIEVDSSFIDELLVEEFEFSSDLITGILAARERAKIGVRWPVSKVSVMSAKIKDITSELIDIVKDATNVKKLEFVENFELNYDIKPRFKEIGKAFGQETGIVVKAINTNKDAVAEGLATSQDKVTIDGFEIVFRDMIEYKVSVDEPYTLGDLKSGYVFLDTTTNDELQAEGYMREVARRIQDTRKSSGLNKEDRIDIELGVSTDLVELVKPYVEDTKTKVGVNDFAIVEVEKANGEEFKVKDKTFKLEFKL